MPEVKRKGEKLLEVLKVFVPLLRDRSSENWFLTGMDESLVLPLTKELM
jgi:hypothetical protein